MAVAQRIKKIIDDDSWLNMLIPSAESVILFVHGTFGDASDTWGSTPDALLSMPALSSFDTGSFGYSSKVFDRRLPEIFAKKLRSWIEVNLNNYVDIYIVAHSMGGLLTRHALYTMLKDPKQYPVIKNIRRCFLVASPVTGSKVAEFLNRVPFISKLHSRLDYLQDPRIDDMPMGEAYENAARVYLNSGGNEIDIPRFHMYTAQDDKIVSLPGKSFYTRYDKDESVVPGTHGTSKENKDVNSMLVMSISQIISSSSGASMSSQILRSTAVQAFAREREHTTSALVSALRSPRSQKQPADVIIISCSNTKSDLHGDFFNTNNSLASEVDDSDLRKLLFATRTRILVSVQSGYVDGIEYKEGNRSKKKSNRELKFGPDFGGQINERSYLPAYMRYQGRCYQATSEEWKKFLESPGRPHILIMSGLYGLLNADDLIQNYDVHLTDVDRQTGFAIQSHWQDRNFLSEILVSHVKWIEENIGPIGNIIDCLSEASYQDSINWSLVRRHWSVYHRVFEKTSGRDALGNLGIWIRDIIRNPECLHSLELDEFYSNDGFEDGDRIAFERIIGESRLKVTR